MANGGEDRAIFLFERCVIACAQYEEFWLKVLDTYYCVLIVLQFSLTLYNHNKLQ